MNVRVGLTLSLVLALSTACSRVETVVPQWTVKVQTREGTPISGVPVRQMWRHFTVDPGGHAELNRTDNTGTVVFPRRYITTNAVTRGLGTIKGYLRSLHEASFGPFGQVLIGIEGDKTGCELLVFDSSKPADVPLTSLCVVGSSYTLTEL